MRRAPKVIAEVFMLIGCNAPATPVIPSVPPRQVNATIEIPAKPTPVVDKVTTTDEPIFIPIPDTFTPTATNTATPMLNAIQATATGIKAAVTCFVKWASTRTTRPTVILTIFLPPTGTLAPIAVQPTNPPAQAC